MNAKLWVVKQILRSELKSGSSPDEIVKNIYTFIRKACADEFSIGSDAMLDNFLSGVFFDTQTTDPETPIDWLEFIVLKESLSAEVRNAAYTLVRNFKL